MKLYFNIIIISLIIINTINAQNKDSIIDNKNNLESKPKIDNKNFEKFLNFGQIFGKIIDSITNKPISGVDIMVFANEFDSSSKKIKSKLIQVFTTDKNGEFSITNLPVLKKLYIEVSNINYLNKKQKIDFNFNMKDMQGGANNMEKLMSSVIKDLGNIVISKNENLNEKNLNEIVISSKKTSDIGKQIFDVSKNLVTSGGTAQDLLKTIPMLNIDVEGNVTIRNSAPQIYVDGRPTTLTLDQIPSDLIDRVEVMTNPSSKYDAEGQGGILNIVLKKSTKLGINANIMAGTYIYMKPFKNDIPSLYHYNGGLILNIRKNKINTFFNILRFARQMQTLTITDRNYLYSNNIKSINNFNQESFSINNGNMNIFRAGVDYFINNRNTISFDVNYMLGLFSPTTDIIQKNTYSDNTINYNSRYSEANNNYFNNTKINLNYKKTFSKEGEELTFNTYAEIRNISFNTYSSGKYYYNKDSLNNKQFYIQNNQLNQLNSNAFKFRFQGDYENPISKDKKIETGINITYNNTPFDNQYFSTDISKNKILLLNKIKYEYGDMNISGYATYSHNINNFSYQIGARIESFTYKGTMYDSLNKTTNYNYTLPLNIFPSIFVTQKLDDKNLVQLSYSMRINRPSIFNLIPAIDYSDSTNLRQGNPNLSPETIHTGEINYQYTNKKNYFLFAFYLKNTSNVITQYQKLDSNSFTGKKLLLNTYVNSSSALNYGFEIVLKNTTLKELIEFNTNFNIYNTLLNGGILQPTINYQLWSFYSKETINIKLPKGFSLQLFFDYQHTKLIPPSSGNRSSQQAGGNPFNAVPASSSQGYIKPNYGMDMAIKKEFLKGVVSLTLTCTDLFASRLFNVNTSSVNIFEQNLSSYRNQTYFYLTLNARLGKMDFGILKKKNIKSEKEQAQETVNGGGF